jgi:5-hydroxyisourate hydrolase-like protein (transthyretin family)
MTSSRTAPGKAVQVDPGSTVTVDFDFTGDVSIKGRVTRNGEPVAGAFVMFNGAGRNDRVSTDSNGRYEVTGLDDGKYGVTVMDPQRGPYSTTYTVSGSATFDIDIRGTTLRGRVVDTSTGQPVADAMVTIRRKDASVAGIPISQTPTDAGGNFAFDMVPAGAYHASAEKPDYGTASSDVTVSDSGADPVQLQLTPSPAILLKVIDARDQQQLNAWYHAVSDANPADVHDDMLRTMSSSTEPIKVTLAAGVWHVTVGAQGYATTSFDITSPGQKIVGLTPGGTIVVSSTNANGTRGRLLDASGQVYGRVGRSGFPPSFPVEIDPLQSTLSNVAPGVYTLQLLDNKNTILKQTQVTIVDGQTVTLKL